ncbi:MAG TPA: hypothetical protein VHY37_04985 [Tepidisphaeraceae bacterium]|jgi:hypothetical protein|nr:hypothetical protein [Tepidisphaeraceae bacterium]
MATQQTEAFQIPGLGKQKTAEVIARARRLGMSPQRYIRRLVEEDLAISDRAKKTSFEELLGPGRKVDEAEVDRLVEAAKVSNYEGKRRRN